MTEPIRILNIFMVLDRGGAETFVMNVYRNIDRSRVQFDFLVHGDEIGAYEEEIKALGGRIYRLPKMENFFVYKKAIKDFFEEHREYQIIHSHASELGMFVLKEAKRRNIPYRICHAHSAPAGFNYKTPIRNLFKQFTNIYSNVFFACSQKAGEWQFGKKREFTIVKNGIDTLSFAFSKEKREEIRNRLDIGNKLVIGHVGRMEKPKNHKFLIEIFDVISKQTDSVLMLIGDGSLKPEIIDEVKAKRLENKVIFIGTVSNVADYLNAMDVFVFPSLFEGLGIVLIEAQTSGLKCFASDRVPEEAGVTDLMKYISLNDLPEKWAQNIIDEAYAHERGKYVQAVQSSGYDITDTANYLQSFYQKCL